MYPRNALVSVKGTTFRVLEETPTGVLVIDCMRRTMPEWTTSDILAAGSPQEENDVLEAANISFKDTPSLEEERVQNERYTAIAPVLAVLGNRNLRGEAIETAAREHGVSGKTIRTWLCLYLAFADKRALAPREKPERALTKDEENFRWALNKFFFTRYGKSLADTYTQLVSHKYTNPDGSISAERPSIHQFRYFYRTRCSQQRKLISREGLKNYQQNHRPLLGGGVRDIAPAVGTGMLDSTICDIYLLDDSRSRLVGRPILTACIDAYSGLCCGYSLCWEGGTYSVRELLLNVVAEKSAWCRKFGIEIAPGDWDSNGALPGTLITDRGSEYAGLCVEQVSELGVRLVNLPAFRAELKGPVERFFGTIQGYFKPQLHGRGVIEQDAESRGVRNYRKDACLTMGDFEKIVLRCILYYNRERIVSGFPYTQDMLDRKVPPHPQDLWQYGRELPGANLITVSPERLVLTLLPRTRGKFTQRGLVANKLRYRNDAYTERYLTGGEVAVAYNPEDVNKVYLVQDGFAVFDLIDSRFFGMSLDAARGLLRQQANFLDAFEDANLQAKVDLARHIQAIAEQCSPSEEIDTSSVRKTLREERGARHRDFMKEASNERN